ncbi:MAG TPA: nitroreductase family deazaflavin-dependent oxidoreductase [Pseudonocardia sp.]|nr:nitroreductase family deazaflavin-dependent oxidoreductase [Pseudonocardia sp.]
MVGRVAARPEPVDPHHGRRSDRAARLSPMLYVRRGDDFAVLGTNFGRRNHPGWTANLLAHPEASVEVGPERLTVTARTADSSVRDELWPRFVALYPGVAGHAERCGRVPRMFLLHPTA